MIDKFPKKLLAAGVIAALGLTACEYDLDDNKFGIEGRVTKIGERSLNVEIEDVDLAVGEAASVFDIGKIVQIHDNCKDCGDGFFDSRKTTGVVYDYREQVTNIDAIDIGSCVFVDGYMREYTSNNSTTHRAEYGVVKIISC